MQQHGMSVKKMFVDDVLLVNEAYSHSNNAILNCLFRKKESIK
jgi:hypothetical protein